jgi:hypothetical protein
MHQTCGAEGNSERDSHKGACIACCMRTGLPMPKSSPTTDAGRECTTEVMDRT